VRLPVKIPRYAGEADQWVEELWRRRLPDGRFEVCCIPFWLPDLALGCEVAPDHPELATRLALLAPPDRATLWAIFDRTAAPGAALGAATRVRSLPAHGRTVLRARARGRRRGGDGARAGRAGRERRAARRGARRSRELPGPARRRPRRGYAGTTRRGRAPRLP